MAPGRPVPPELDLTGVQQRVSEAHQLTLEFLRGQPGQRLLAGHQALGALDAGVEQIQRVRAALDAWLRQRKLALNDELDRLLAELRIERFPAPPPAAAPADPAGWNYERPHEEPTGGPVPPDIEGHGLGGRAEP